MHPNRRFDGVVGIDSLPKKWHGAERDAFSQFDHRLFIGLTFFLLAIEFILLFVEVEVCVVLVNSAHSCRPEACAIKSSMLMLAGSNPSFFRSSSRSRCVVLVALMGSSSKLRGSSP